MLFSLLAQFLTLSFWLGAVARPQGGELGRSPPWWMNQGLSQPPLSSVAVQSTDTQQPNSHVDLDLHLGGSSQDPDMRREHSDFDLNAIPRAETQSDHSSPHVPLHSSENPAKGAQVLGNYMPMTLDEHQQARLGLWNVPGWANYMHAGSIPTDPTRYQHAPVHILHFGQAGSSTASTVVTNGDPGHYAGHESSQDVSSSEAPRKVPREAPKGRFEFKSYNYDHPGLQHLMEPKLVPRTLISHMHSSRGSTRVYRPDPDVLRAIETFVRDRVGNSGVFVRRPSGEGPAYGVFLQPSLVEAQKMHHLMQIYRLQPIGFSNFLTIHPLAMDRAANVVITLKKAAKTIYFPSISVDSTVHHVMAVPQKTKFPLNTQRASGVMFHFWEGLAPVTYVPDFPTFRAYLGAMMLDYDHFDKWTDVSRLDMAARVKSIGHA